MTPYRPEAKSGSTSLIRYEYDGLTRRIEEGSTDQYFSAAWQVLEERVANAVTASYAWSPVYVDAMIARDRDSDDNGSLDKRLYALQDANFNVTAVADTSGDIVERYLFDPYGKRVILDPNFSADADNTSDFAFMHGHQGGKYDSVLTNQMLFRNRVYDVESMRWLQMDPAGYVDGLSSFQYSQSGPVAGLDPFGMWKVGTGVSAAATLHLPFLVGAGLGAGVSASYTSTDWVGWDAAGPFCVACDSAAITIQAGAGLAVNLGIGPVVAAGPGNRPGPGVAIQLGVGAGLPAGPDITTGIEIIADVDVSDGTTTITIPRFSKGATAYVALRVTGSCNGCTNGIGVFRMLPNNVMTRVNQIIGCVNGVMTTALGALQKLNGKPLSIPDGKSAVEVKVPGNGPLTEPAPPRG